MKHNTRNTPFTVGQLVALYKGKVLIGHVTIRSLTVKGEPGMTVVGNAQDKRYTVSTKNLCSL